MQMLVDFANSNEFAYNDLWKAFYKTGVDRNEASEILRSLFSQLSSFEDFGDLSFIKIALANEDSSPNVKSA